MRKLRARSSSLLWSCWTPHQPWRSVLAFYAFWDQSLLFALCRCRLPSLRASGLLLSFPLCGHSQSFLSLRRLRGGSGEFKLRSSCLGKDFTRWAISRHLHSLSCVNRALNSLPLSTKTPYKNNLRAKFINLLMNSPGGSQVLPPPSHTPDALRQCCFVSVLTQP